MREWWSTRTGQIVLFLLFVLTPLLLTLLLGGGRMPAWDNCTFGWAIPC